MESDERMSEEMGAENEFPFESNETQNGGHTRNELKEKHTVKELAKMAEPLQTTYSFNSLKGRSKDFLCDIILGVNGEEQPKISTAKASHKATKNDSENIVEMGLNVLNAFKKQREGEQAQLNPIAKELFINSAVNQVDKARADGVLKTDKFNSILLGVSGIALVVDGVVGFENVPTLFSKAKSMFTRKGTNG